MSASSGELRRLLDGRRRAVLSIAVVAFVGGLLEAVFLVVITRAAFAVTDGTDRVEFLGRSFQIGTTVWMSLALIVARIGANLAGNWQAAELTSAASAASRTELSEAFFDASWGVQQGDRSGRLQELLTNFADRSGGVLSSITGLVTSSFNLLAILGLAVLVNPGASVLVFGTVVGLGVVLLPIRRVVERRSRGSAVARISLASSLNEISQVGMEVHVFNVQPMAKREVSLLIEQNKDRQRSVAFLQGIAPVLYSGLAYIVLAGAVAFVSASSTASLTSLGASMLLMLRSLFYGQNLQTNIVSLSSAGPFIASMEEQLQRYRDGRITPEGDHVESVGAISLRNIGFEYIAGQPVLFDIDASLAPRQMVGIIGPSGSGKSTLVQLMLGLRRPTTGQVLADGRDIAELARNDWARRVTFVPQTPHLVSGSVADNIRFFRPDVSDADVERAARLAHVHDDIMSWTDGYRRDVGPRGSNLSGGQQQRVCIARALVEDPDVIILDEPTSSLDGRSEALIRETLGRLRNTMTVIVIAHRLSTLSLCDRLMIIEEGRLKAFDTPANLEASSAFYREALLISGVR